MEVLLLALFFLVTIIFFVAGKDDFGRKEIKSKQDMTKEAKIDKKDEPKDEENKLKPDMNEEVKIDKKDEPKDEEKKEVL